MMEKGSVELQHVMRHVSLTGDVDSPVQFIFKHLELAVVNIGSLLCIRHCLAEETRVNGNMNEGVF